MATKRADNTGGQQRDGPEAGMLMRAFPGPYRPWSGVDHSLYKQVCIVLLAAFWLLGGSATVFAESLDDILVRTMSRRRFSNPVFKPLGPLVHCVRQLPGCNRLLQQKRFGSRANP